MYTIKSLGSVSLCSHVFSNLSYEIQTPTSKAEFLFSAMEYIHLYLKDIRLSHMPSVLTIKYAILNLWFYFPDPGKTPSEEAHICTTRFLGWCESLDMLWSSKARCPVQQVQSICISGMHFNFGNKVENCILIIFISNWTNIVSRAKIQGSPSSISHCIFLPSAIRTLRDEWFACNHYATATSSMQPHITNLLHRQPL